MLRVPTPAGMVDDEVGAEGQWLFHLALRRAAAGGGSDTEAVAADILGSGSLHAVKIAQAIAGVDLAAHPDDVVLRRVVLLLGCCTEDSLPSVGD